MEDFALKELARQKEWFNENLKKDYSVVGSSFSLTNGLSIYIKVLRKGEKKYFKFRISDHINGNSADAISESTLSYEVQGRNLNVMYAFFGDITKEEAQLQQWDDYLKDLENKGKKDSPIYKHTEKLKEDFLRRKSAKNQ